jgi:hypothetical protein
VPTDILAERASEPPAHLVLESADGPPPEAEAETASAARPATSARDTRGSEALSPDVPVPQVAVDTPIFDTISMWFSSDSSADQADRVIDLRDRPEGPRSRASSARWSSLGDQRWLATNARAAAAPEVAGTTEVGLPRRRPGANLIPSAAAAAPASAPSSRPESGRRAGTGAGGRGDAAGRASADAVRGRLSSYQRGLTSARRARHLPAERSGSALFAAPRGGENESGRGPGEQGG